MQLFLRNKYKINTCQALLNACQALVDQSMLDIWGLIAQVLDIMGVGIMGLDILGTTRLENPCAWMCLNVRGHSA